MKKLLFFISLFLIILIKVYSQSSVYKVEKDGKSIYIGGTVHLLRTEDYPLPQEFYDAYSKSDILVFETDLKELESPELMAELMTYSQYEEGNSLSKNLSPEIYTILKEKFESKGLSIEAFETFKPSMVILTLSALSMQEMNIESEGVDQHFNLFANTLNITNEIYSVARRPAGLRPGMPRAFNLGIKANF